MSTSMPVKPPNLSGLKGRAPFQGKYKLRNVVRIRFQANAVSRVYDAQLLHLRKGDMVIAETSRGPGVALVLEEVRREVAPKVGLRKILRKATAIDQEQDKANRRMEEDAFRFALKYIHEHNLRMKMVRVQVVHDTSRAIFYFSSESRVDFRDLVRELAVNFQTRIEMRQIGARDSARMIGGIGPCGRELCCSTFLENFAPVSIRMAKDQGLTLNPRKVSGMCGRLMCCLIYEQQVYHDARRRLPRAGRTVLTANGPGVIRSVDVLQKKVNVLMDEGGVDTLPIQEIQILSRREIEARRTEEDGPPPAISAEDRLRMALNEAVQGEDEYLWDDDAPGEKAARDKKKRRPGRRKTVQRTPDKKAQGRGATTSDDKGEQGSGNKRRRPSRRRTQEGGEGKGRKAPQRRRSSAKKTEAEQGDQARTSPSRRQTGAKDENKRRRGEKKAPNAEKGGNRAEKSGNRSENKKGRPEEGGNRRSSRRRNTSNRRGPRNEEQGSGQAQKPSPRRRRNSRSGAPSKPGKPPEDGSS